MTALMPGGAPCVSQLQALADDRIEEALGLARAGAGRDQRRPAAADGPDRLFLVAVDVGDLGRDALAHVRVEDALAHQVLDRRALPERARQADVGPLQQRRLPRLVEREQPPHLRDAAAHRQTDRP